MNKPAMMEYALHLLRLLNERKRITSRVVADEFDVDIRTAQRYLLHLSALPCVVVDEATHSYSLASDYFSDRILNSSEMTLFLALVDYATHIFGEDHSKFLAAVKNRVLREPGIYRIVNDEAIDLDRVADVQVALERFIKTREAVRFAYRKSGKTYVADPYRILYQGGFWYLVGRHDGKVKKWNLDMIEGLKGMKRWYEAIPPEMEAAIDTARSIWFDARPPERVTVDFDPEVAHYFTRKPFFPGQEIVGALPGGGVRLSFDVHGEMDLKEQLARWMPYFRVVSPEKHRGHMADVARRAAEKNGP
jgi:predicted DNA-binding transcriptional regulator YafY